MVVRIAEIHPAPAVPVVDLHVIGLVRPAAVRNVFFLDTPEYGVEISFAHPEGVVVMIEIAVVFEIQREPVVHPDRCEVRMGPVIRQPEYAREEAGRYLLVAGGNDGVVEFDGHPETP